MPKAPKALHPLHHIRKAKRMTQSQLAAILGVSEGLIQKIELGGPISDPLKSRILNLFGIRPESLEKGQIPRSLFHSSSGDNLSLKAAIEAWEKAMPVIDEVISMQCEDRFLPMLRVLFQAARGAKRSATLATSFETWFLDEAKKLNLESKTDRLLAEAKISKTPWVQWFRRGDTLRVSLCLPDADDEKREEMLLKFGKSLGVDSKEFPKGRPERALAKHDKA